MKTYWIVVAVLNLVGFLTGLYTVLSGDASTVTWVFLPINLAFTYLSAAMAEAER